MVELDSYLDPCVAARRGNARAIRVWKACHGMTRLSAHRCPAGGTPLHHAADAGRETVCQLLLGWGCDPMARTSLGATAMHYAVLAGSIPCIGVIAGAAGAQAVVEIGPACGAAWRGNLSLHELAQVPRTGKSSGDVLIALKEITQAAISTLGEEYVCGTLMV